MSSARELGELPVHHHETLVVGAGVAGLSTALWLGRATVLSNAPIGIGGSSPMAQGGVAVAIGVDDSPAVHRNDTLAVAGGIGDEEVVGMLTKGGPAALAELRRLGARFDGAETLTDVPLLGREAGHRRRRIVHANGDATGAEIMRTLTLAALAAPTIKIVDNVTVIDLVFGASGEVCGVIGRQDGQLVVHLAASVVLATGGYGHCFARTTTPEHVMGDGIAMWRSDALADRSSPR